MKIRALAACFFLAVGLYAQAPAITSVQNPASNILPGLPNFGTAQGQIFVLYGANMGPSAIAVAPALPLSTTLSGTSVKITQAGTVYNAPMVYTVNSQVAAVLPSNVPPGPATVQVTYNGAAGNSFMTTIVDSNFGISTIDQSGAGAAVITYPTSTAPFYALVTTANSAIPGNTYTMWGTGLGAANSDNNIATNGDLGTPIQVFVGGVPATVTYRGRSGAPGLDQINFTVPLGISGCAISLVVETTTASATRVSNVLTFPVAPGGGQCSDTSGPSSSVITSALAKGGFTVGGVSLDGDQKQAMGLFLHFTAAQTSALLSSLETVSSGNCATAVYVGTNGSGHSDLNRGSGAFLNSTGVDAGANLTLTQPAGAPVTMALAQPGLYSGNITGLSSGAYQLSGTGGKDIPAFSTSFNGPPAFTWTSQNTKTVVRNQGLKVTWTGGDANTAVSISGFSANGGNSAQFYCQVPAAPGSFTVPPSILLALPGTTGAAPNGNLYVYLQSGATAITIPGTDYGFAAWNTPTQGIAVTWQ